MAKSVREIVGRAHKDPEKGPALLVREARRAIEAGDAARARPLVLALLGLSIERGQPQARHGDLFAWLLGQQVSLQVVLWVALYARMISDGDLERRALSQAPTAPLAS